MNQNQTGKIDLLPPGALESYEAYIRSGDESALLNLVGAIFTFHEVAGFEEAYAARGESLVIMEDLEVDSLTLTEVIFFAEGLLDIKISNEEILQIRTVGDLKSFIISRHSDNS